MKRSSCKKNLSRKKVTFPQLKSNTANLAHLWHQIRIFRLSEKDKQLSCIGKIKHAKPFSLCCFMILSKKNPLSSSAPVI
ncbi:MAG: hypothetical protein KID09_27820 [Paenibacillus macerans]|nr:hypothetical protein [Paenibacillus macerans]